MREQQLTNTDAAEKSWPFLYQLVLRAASRRGALVFPGSDRPTDGG